MKKIIIFSFLMLGVFGACGKQEKKPTIESDFEVLMGKEHPHWKFVQTKDDFENLAFFRNLYEGNVSLLTTSQESYKIPQVIHFIWLGPNSFPLSSIENVHSWIGKHPDWTVCFWTDRVRALPHPSMKMRFISDLQWEKEELKICNDNSDNWAEKSDILRIEILSQEGGVYVDHDVKCLHAFDSLNRAFDLYCGMEMPYKTALESSVLPTNNILAARKSHPVLTGCKDWLIANWELIGKSYPGTDRESVINRISHRTFYVLGKILKQKANQNGNHDIALPTYFFNSPKEEWGLFAQHKYAGTWFENESKFEKSTRGRLMYLSKKANKAILFVSISTLINILGFAWITILILKKKKA